jgi:hypothetical protein
VVRQPDYRKARYTLAAFAWVTLACSPLGFYLLQIMRHVEVDYAIERVRHRQESLMETERRLAVERAEITSFPRIEIRATTELGLERAEPSRTLVLRADDRTGALKFPASHSPRSR